MYLKVLLTFVVLIVHRTTSECGCKTNRDAQKRYADYYTDNNEPNQHIDQLKTAFDTSDMALIDSGTFEMGSDKPHFATDFETPIRNVTVDKPFYLDKYEVSNRHFYDFVEKTGYKTEAETFGDSFLFEMFISEDERGKYEDVRAVQAPWWLKIKGVSWKNPEGPGSTINGKQI